MILEEQWSAIQNNSCYYLEGFAWNLGTLSD